MKENHATFFSRLLPLRQEVKGEVVVLRVAVDLRFTGAEGLGFRV
jgi:hypothetical protein